MSSPLPASLRSVAVLGLGLLGGSLCHALRATANPPTLTGYAHRASTLARAREIGLADVLTDDLPAAVGGADLVVLCSPVGTFEALLRGVAPYLKSGAIVTDVGSTKRSVCRLARELLPSHARFVGSHPMAGGERAGADHARADLFRGATVIVTPEEHTDPAAAPTVADFWTALGSRVLTLSPETHDRLVASVSHLPHCTAAMLVSLQTPTSVDLAGNGYRDSTRIAAGDPDLWRDILIDNRDHIAAALRALRDQTDHLIAALEKGDADAVRAYLAAAAARGRPPIR